MKKFIWTVVATMLVVLGFASCDGKDANGNELIYNVTATAEGQVDFSWFNGGAEINGNAIVTQCNDTAKVKLLGEENIKGATLLSEALNSSDEKVKNTATFINKFISVEGVEGNYHLSIKGYVKYGPMIFRIDEEYPQPVD